MDVQNVEPLFLVVRNTAPWWDAHDGRQEPRILNGRMLAAGGNGLGAKIGSQ